MNTNIVERSKQVLLEVGSAPVMYLMLALSVVSVAIMIERAWFFAAVSENIAKLAEALAERLNRHDVEAAHELVAGSKSAEAAIVAAGLKQLTRGSEAAAEAMASATALQRMRLERRLAFLGTLGNNAPFIGLLGTVIGIVQAFDKLQATGLGGAATGPATDVMGAISESLVATAIGLVVAIPAVAAFNYFQRKIRATVANSDALTHILLAYAKGEAAAATTEVSHSGARRAAAVREQPEAFSMQRISTIPG
ncbi:MAG TPA: MotA/TolQ/ExbB proton channel family protein [Polyangiaceae bacterium]|nr:MotA/TolQ/ExbB proton channel family protein [Polyangiaceae bacterium]